MRNRVALQEGRRNALAARWRSLAVLCVLAALQVGVACAEAFELAALRKAELAQLEAGARTIAMSTAVDAEQDGVDAAACHRLDSAGHAIHAGPVWSVEGGSTLGPLPGRSLDTYLTSEGGARALGLDITVQDPSEYDGWDGLVGTGLSEDLGLVPGVPRRFSVGSATSGSQLVVLRPTELSSRWRSLASAMVFLGERDVRADECWVAFPAWADEATMTSVLGSMPEMGEELELRLISPPSGLVVQPSSEARRRLTQHGWVVSSILGAGVLALLARARRNEAALYRSLGVSVWERMAILGSEFVVVGTGALCVAVAATAWVVVIAAFRFRLETAAIVMGLRQLLLSYLATVVLAVVASSVSQRGVVADALKE